MAGEIIFTPGEADYADANREWHRAAWARPASLGVMAFLVLLAAGLGALVPYLEGDEGQVATTAAAFALLLLVLLPVIYGLVYFVFLPLRVRRLYRQHKMLQRSWTYRWSAAGFSAESAGSLTTHRWSDFHRWRDGREMLLLFVNDQMFYFLPRRLLGEASVLEICALAEGAGVRRF